MIFDPSPEFVGGPNVAVSTIGKIGSKASRSLLEEALAFWKKSLYPEAFRVRAAILQALNLRDEEGDLRAILKKAGSDRWINVELPKVAAEYFRRTPDEANGLFVTALRSYSKEVVYGGTLPWAVLSILPQIPITDNLLEAAIDLARRRPGESFPWRTIAGVWQRRDLSTAQRAFFYVTGASE